MKELLAEFAKLNIPDGQYAIYGSGPLAIRGIREARDLDVVVRDGFYQELIKEYPEKEKGKIEINAGDIEIFPAWNSLINEPEEVIGRAELIEGFRFITIEDLVIWKKELDREKDHKDLKLIKRYRDQ
ncbi:MAG: hypothetical protein ACLFNN_02170 [Candidatus Paceibacterota bacterium]